MLRKVLVTIATVILVFGLSGCKKRSGEPSQEPTKTMQDYQAEAEKEIDRENMADELEKLEEEIEDDILSSEEF